MDVLPHLTTIDFLRQAAGNRVHVTAKVTVNVALKKMPGPKGNWVLAITTRVRVV
jgi:hypothetical protein